MRQNTTCQSADYMNEINNLRWNLIEVTMFHVPFSSFTTNNYVYKLKPKYSDNIYEYSPLQKHKK